MFVRKKKNKSGIISVQVIDKSTGKYQLIKTIGSSSDSNEIETLFRKGKLYIQEIMGQLTLDYSEKNFQDKVVASIQDLRIEGIDLLLGKLYSEVGFDQVGNNLLKQLVLVRLSHPASKLRTSEYLQRYYSIDVSEDKIYRYLDKIYTEEKEKIQQISYEHTLKILGGFITIVFYDVTTLYFQIDDEDEIRKRGFSKEGKHQNPQIILGLLVSVGGYPLAYEIHEGNKFEGHTMLPILESFRSRYRLDKLIIVADSGLISTNNIKDLDKKGYEFIIGARIKNESKPIKDKIQSLEKRNGKNEIIEISDKLKLIINYSDKRAQKDNHNRQRGLQKLEKKIKSGKLSKSNINNRGYNKYLQLEGEVRIKIDYEKFQNESKWDGLKGYITNTKLSKDDVVKNYNQLWKIEKAFRISKHDLKIRPIYHRLQRRIEAHITLNFMAYKIYKELERVLKEKESKISPEKAIEIAKSIYSVKIMDPRDNHSRWKTLILNDEQKLIFNLFGT